jgi:hypothetical protein
MKKTILIIAAIGMTYAGTAQDKYVVSALTALKGNNYDEAKDDIDKAMANPETKEKPKALFAKAQIYLQLQNVAKYKETAPYREAAQTLIKLAAVKADYERATVDGGLLFCAFYYYNDGAKAYNDKKLVEASELMKNVVKIHDMDGGKRFEKSENGKKFDTVAAEANQTLANSIYYSGKYDEAIPLLTTVKNNPITRNPSVYECLIDAYNRQKNTAQAFATIEEARKFFPNDVTLRNYELNYYITAGKQDELVKKLEEAATKEPENADIQFNIATTYLGMANPKEGKKPANTAELTTKSEEAFLHALKIAPDNAAINYNFGALYFNQATDVNEQMNNTPANDQKKWDELKVKRDAIFVKSTPYFERAFTVLSANESTLKGDDLKTYKSSLMALNKIYALQNKADKASDMKKRLDSLPK